MGAKFVSKLCNFVILVEYPPHLLDMHVTINGDFFEINKTVKV